MKDRLCNTIPIIAFCITAAVAPALHAEQTQLTIEEAEAMALSHSPALEAGRATVEAAVYREQEALRSRLPHLSLSTGYVRVQERDPLTLNIPNAALTLGDSISDSISASAEINQPIFTGGAILSRINLAATVRRSSEVDLTAQRRDLLLQTRNAFWNVVEAEARVVAIEDRLAQVRRVLEDTQSRAAAGLVTRSNVLAVEMRLAEVELRRIQATNGHAIAIAALARLTGLPPETEIVTATPIPERVEGNVPSLDELSSRALERRSDIAKLQSAVASRRAQLDAARARRLPNVYATGTVTVSRPAPSVFPAELSFGTDWTAGIVGRYELGDQPGVTQAIAAAEQDVQAALAAVAAAEEGVLFDVRRAYLEWNTAQEEVRAAQTIVRRSEEHLSETENRLAAGAAIQADELDAQAQLLEARLSLTSARVGLLKAREALLRATGEIGEETDGW